MLHLGRLRAVLTPAQAIGLRRQGAGVSVIVTLKSTSVAILMPGWANHELHCVAGAHRERLVEVDNGPMGVLLGIRARCSS